MTDNEPESVLIVGTSANADLLDAALESAGFAVHPVDNPYEAALRFEDLPRPRALVHLDALDDAEVEIVRTLRRVHPRARILVTCSHPHRHRAAEALRLGADAFLPEPYYLSEVVALLRSRSEPHPPGAPAVAEEPAAPSERDGSGAIGTGGGATPAVELEEFAGGVAHEINNPLTVVSGWVEVLLAEAPHDDPRRRRLQSILEEVQRIQRVVENLRSFARTATGAFEPLDAGAELRTFVDRIRAEGGLRGLEVEIRVEAGLPSIRADREALLSLFGHLVRNAVEATRARGSLRIDVSTKGDAVRLLFADDGPGVPPEHRARLFQPFFSGFAGANHTGLGLAACRGIVSRHGGAIRLLPETGAGASFEVLLPIAGPIADRDAADRDAGRTSAPSTERDDFGRGLSPREGSH